MTEHAQPSVMWGEDVPVDLTEPQLELLSQRLGMTFPWYFRKDEWIVGYRVVVADGDDAAILRARRRHDEPGITIELVSSLDMDLSWVEELRVEVRLAIAGSLQAELPSRSVVTMGELLESGVHFGHPTRRWNPKTKRFIFTERNGIYIIDLQQTLTYIDKAYEFVKETVAHGGTVLFVGTKKQAQEAIEQEAKRVGMPFVNQRWLGGMLTNFSTVYQRLQRLKELEMIEQTGGATVMTKKEALVLGREREKLERTLGGIRDMTRTPSAVWVIDTEREHIAVGEARKLGIPVVAVVDTNCDPDEVDYKIPGNDDAIRSATLLTRVIADAVAEGLMQRQAMAANAGRGDKPDVDGRLAADEPLADWEVELLKERTGEPATSSDRPRVPKHPGFSPTASEASATAPPREATSG